LHYAESKVTKIVETETKETIIMEYTIAQLNAGLSNAMAEYRTAKNLFAKIPTEDNLHHCERTHARVERINVMIAAA